MNKLNKSERINGVKKINEIKKEILRVLCF